MGAEGTTGGVLITASSDGSEVQPREFLTLKVYVPAERLFIVMVVVEPAISEAPGLTITV
jgi:hypothetical protein